MRRLLCGTALLIALAASAPAQEGSNLFQSLAGPGESVNLRAKTLDMKTAPDGSIERFSGTERVVLESPKLNLKANLLTYVEKEGILRATGSVSIDQPGVKASAETLVYDIANEEIVLTGSPRVEQDNGENRSVFEGMEEFRLKTLPSGETEIRMSGGDMISAQISTPEPQDNAPVESNKPKGGGGFAGLGDDVNIQTRSRTDKAAEMNVRTNQDGGIGLFQAVGSVVLKSEQMDLRADIIEFDGVRNLVEALYDVYLKQGEIDADCGRMLYDLNEDKITLSVNPNVRQRQADGTMVISDMDRFVIVREPDGSTSTDAIGVDRDPKFSWEAKPVVRTPAMQDTTPREIRINSDEDLSRLRMQSRDADRPENRNGNNRSR